LAFCAQVLELTYISSEETYNLLREHVVERTFDKEPVIRAHAIIALSKLAGTEDPDELGSGESTAVELVLEAMCYDSAVYVSVLILPEKY